MKRLRLLEETRGHGVLRSPDGTRSTPTDYHLVVEVEQVRAGRDWLDGLQVIQARTTADQGFVLDAVMQSLPLVLQMEDGRQFECWMSGDGLLIARTGHALRKADEPHFHIDSLARPS